MSTQTTTDKTNSRYLKDSHHARFAFHSAALDPSTFFVSHFTATEEISQPFRVEIDLLSHDPDIDAELIINELATFSLETKGNAREFYGILAEFNQGEEGVDGLYHYQAVLVPRLWQMGLSVQNQIYQNLSVPEIIEAELLGSSEKHEEEHAAIALDSTDFEFRLTREYEIKEYVVQYKESDLNFISRLAEQAGIFYFFEFENGREKLIFSDNNIQFPFICDEHEVRYVRQSALMGYEEASVQSFNLKKTR
ncbi:MAG: type VI secretion system tip protein VgrG, partial [Gammaproteobacteria bacterium]|nr:type VI secretion system tip protein VgrG [Gammaproteobacteria bacterium]